MPFFYTDRKNGKNRHSLGDNQFRATVSSNASLEGLVLHQVPICEIIDGGGARKELRTRVRVYATPERLWQVIMEDQKSISNAIEIRQKQGRMSPNSKDSFALIGRSGNRSRVKLTRFHLNRELGWKKREFLFPGLLAKETLFQIMPDDKDAGVALIRSEIFTGLLVPFLNGMIRTARTDVQLSSIQIREKAEAIS